MVLKQVFGLIYLLLLGLVGAEFFVYKGLVANYLVLNLWQFIALYGVGFLVWRQIVKPKFQSWRLIKFNRLFILPLLIATTISLYLIESYTYSNYVFGHLGLNHLALIPGLILSLIFQITTSTRNHLSNFWPSYLLSGFLLVCLFLRDNYFEFFYKLTINKSGQDDDNFMEWLQVVILFGGVIIAGKLAIIAKASKWLRMVYLATVLFFVLLIGEEISWGERIFALDLPVSEANHQNEANIHNLEVINEFIILLYILAFVYALISWLVRRFVVSRKKLGKTKVEWLNIFCFRGQEVLYFIPTFIVNPYADRALYNGGPSILNLYHSWGLIPDFYDTLNFLTLWRESFEVVFYSGLVIHFFSILMGKLKKKSA